MLLGNNQIYKAVFTEPAKKKKLSIIPIPNPNVLKKGTSSIDLRLGTWFLSINKSSQAVIDVCDSIKQNAHHNTPHGTYHYVPFKGKFFIHPQQFVLAATLEWIQMPHNLAGYVIGRSSWGRRGLIIATATGVHPGFSGCLTLELSNVGEVPIVITPGFPICQLFLHTVDEQRTSKHGIFFGLRRPILGKIDLSADEFFSRLGSI